MVSAKFPTVKEPRLEDARIILRSPKQMTREQARETARDILHIIPAVMRTVAAQLRSAGELPAPAHFGLLSILCERSRMLTELASLQGVSLPTMSNSISAMEERGWVRRTAPTEADRRVAMIEVTPAGRAALDRVARSAEAHLAEMLAPIDVTSRRRLHNGLGVLRKIFAAEPAAPPGRHRGRRGRRPYVV
jgi:DNA-binding MarR family transcriptional regulator